MPKPSYEQLDEMYRGALRQIVQLTHRAERFERLALVSAARHRQAAQAIDLSIEEIKRDERDQETARGMERIAQHTHVTLDARDTAVHRGLNGKKV